MQLMRLATVTLSHPVPQRLGRWTYTTSGGVTVAVMEPISGVRDITNEPAQSTSDGVTIEWSYVSDQAALLVHASTRFAADSLNEDKELVIPEATRALVEDGIREYADILAVTYQCQRLIRSPSPYIAVRADDTAERTLISEATGIAAPAAARPRVGLIPELRPEVGYGPLIARSAPVVISGTFRSASPV